MMRRVAFIVLLALGVGIGGGLAQVKFGYVDSEKILTSFPAALDAQNKLEQENTEWGKEFQKLEDNVRSLREQLDQQSLLLSDAKKLEKEEEIRALLLEIQQFQNQKWGQQGEYFKRQEDLMRPVLDRINAAIRKVGEEEECDIIFDTVQGNVLYAKERYDLTDKVLAELEKEAATNTESQR